MIVSRTKAVGAGALDGPPSVPVGAGALDGPPSAPYEDKRAFLFL